jgi:hypothetical protein
MAWNSRYKLGHLLRTIFKISRTTAWSKITHALENWEEPVVVAQVGQGLAVIAQRILHKHEKYLSIFPISTMYMTVIRGEPTCNLSRHHGLRCNRCLGPNGHRSHVPFDLLQANLRRA